MGIQNYYFGMKNVKNDMEIGEQRAGLNWGASVDELNFFQQYGHKKRNLLNANKLNKHPFENLIKQF